jgi:hypothetical protein
LRKTYGRVNNNASTIQVIAKESDDSIENLDDFSTNPKSHTRSFANLNTYDMRHNEKEKLSNLPSNLENIK